VSPVECLLCLLVLQIYYDHVYLHGKFIPTAGICTRCVYSVVARSLSSLASINTGSSSGSGSDSDSDNERSSSGSCSCSEQDNVVTVSDDSE